MHTHPLPSLQRLLLASLAGLVVAGLFQNVIGTDSEDLGGALGYLAVMLLVNGALGAWLFLRFIPRAVQAGPQTAARRAAVLGGVAVVTVLAFWLGLPITLGVAAAVLGQQARARDGGGLATLALVLGSLALLGTVGITILDEIDGSTA